VKLKGVVFRASSARRSTRRGSCACFSGRGGKLVIRPDSQRVCIIIYESTELKQYYCGSRPVVEFKVNIIISEREWYHDFIKRI
jgi:hypothetical protein